jgi:hypothetical protein
MPVLIRDEMRARKVSQSAISASADRGGGVVAPGCGGCRRVGLRDDQRAMNKTGSAISRSIRPTNATISTLHSPVFGYASIVPATGSCI